MAKANEWGTLTKKEHAELVRTLKIALSELIHLGAEEPDIAGKPRKSPACKAIRKALYILEVAP
jgi:hypothetical protein